MRTKTDEDKIIPKNAALQIKCYARPILAACFVIIVMQRKVLAPELVQPLILKTLQEVADVTDDSDC